MVKLNPNILTDPFGGLTAQFGVPTCILGLTKDLLSLIPGGVLAGLHSGMGGGMLAARGSLANVTKFIFRDLGIIEYDTLTGKFAFISDTSQWGVDGFGLGILSDIFEFIGELGGTWSEIYRNIDVLEDQIDALRSCMQDYDTWLKGVENKSTITSEDELTSGSGKLAIYRELTKGIYEFLSAAQTLQTNIEEIFQERDMDPSLIPVFEDEDEVAEEPIFRLTFGPPNAKEGQFILSVDGLYYDSQTREYGSDDFPTDVPTLADLSSLEFIPDESRWLLDHAPNLGGRGTSYSLGDLDRYVNTIFDLNHIDESKDMKEWYDADHLVSFLVSQKNKRIDDIHANLIDLRASGYSTDSAIYLNFDQQIITESAAFNNKINKRKKQIEAAAKTLDVFGFATPFSKGNVPVNDFSYLSSVNLNISISQQKNLAFDHGEVSGIILPIVPKYVHADESTQQIVVTPLLVTPPGVGSIVDGEELETTAPILSLVTGITTDDLIAVYNFTDVNFQEPNSSVFDTLNCNALGTENRAQTVTNNPSLMFQKGLGIPYLTGIPVRDKVDSFTEFTGETWGSHEFKIADSGNFIRLPDLTAKPTQEDYRDLLYSYTGATIDFWTYIPGLYQQESGWWEHPFDTSSFGFALSSSEGKWCDGHYYRVLLGCENTGGENIGLDQSAITIDNSSDSVKGMVMGFSRDPRMYYDGSSVVPGSNDFDPRSNFGGVVDGVSGLATEDLSSLFFPLGAYGPNVSGIWAASSNDQPKEGQGATAYHQVSGVFSVSSDGTISYFVGLEGSSGDGYTSSSNDRIYSIYTLSDGGTPFDDAVQASAVLRVSYFGTGTSATLNAGTPSTVFFVAPTRSYNTSSVGFTRGLDCEVGGGDILKFTVSDEVLSNSVKLKDCANKFVNISVVFDVPNDKLKFCMNGNIIKSATLSQVFGRRARSSPQVPSFIVPNNIATSSFEYTSGTVTQYNDVTLFDKGPKNNVFFTPWIVGGGWTDGRDINLATSSGGFLDVGAGIMSAYNGYVGSLKIYKKALTIKELKANYNHQKTFFENMDL